MTSDKQIEEMYKDVYEAINHNRVIDVTHDCYIDVNTIGLTKELYDDGYRKASDVAREIFEEIEYSMSLFEDDDDGYLLKKCEFEFFMRELKKKYIGEDTNVPTKESEGV